MVTEKGRLNPSLVLLAGSAALVAVVSTPVTLPIQVLLACIVAVGTGNALARTGRASVITHDPETQRWHIQQTGGIHMEGTLVQAGYKSPLVVVLVIQTADTACRRIAVWQDQVTAEAFSYLHHQLMSNTCTAQPQSIRALLGLARLPRTRNTHPGETH